MKKSLRGALMFGVLFLGLSLLGDWYWERPQPPSLTAFTVVLTTLLFWVFTAYRLKAKAS